jgi:uncharacterized protein with PIN domain
MAKQRHRRLARAVHDCPHCSRTGAMKIIFVNERDIEVPSVSGAAKSMWRCTVCGRRADHQ